jgi:uncharacterized protein YcbK (DUF882 family)
MLGFEAMLGRLGLRLLSMASASSLYLSCGATVPPAVPAAPIVAVAAAAPPRVEAVAIAPPVAPWAVALEPLSVECANSGAKESLRIYSDDGSLRPASIEAFSRVAADFNGYAPLSPRLVQLAVKAAHHFHSNKLVVVSGFRQKRAGKIDHHTRGEALDFKLAGVDYRKLAAYLRTYPLVGVGVYTNPKTQYVHLDVRERSYHWLDASPPGVTWREGLLADPSQAARDASYTPESDLPIDGHE